MEAIAADAPFAAEAVDFLLLLFLSALAEDVLPFLAGAFADLESAAFLLALSFTLASLPAVALASGLLADVCASAAGPSTSRPAAKPAIRAIRARVIKGLSSRGSLSPPLFN